MCTEKQQRAPHHYLMTDLMIYTQAVDDNYIHLDLIFLLFLTFHSPCHFQKKRFEAMPEGQEHY